MGCEISKGKATESSKKLLSPLKVRNKGRPPSKRKESKIIKHVCYLFFV